MKILHFADLHIGVETYGRLNPETGLSTRLEDFLEALDKLVDYAIENKIDLVLFCGDAYKSREPTQTQQREFAKRIYRLSIAGIPIFLLIGNHDLPNAIGKATSTEIFDILTIKNVYVSNRPQVHRIPTKSGEVQIVSLPWLRRNDLLTKEDTKNLTVEQIEQRLKEAMTEIIADKAKELDPELPAVLAAHVWVKEAEEGSEKSMTIGQEHALTVSNVDNPVFDYIALGHLHKHQVLGEKPPVVYAGSLERVDFGEAEDEKGFYIVEITPDATGKRQVSYDFHPLEGRRFVKVSVEVKPDTIEPTSAVLQAISQQQAAIRDAIVRLQISLPAEMEGQLRDSDIRNALKEAHYVTIAKEIRRRERQTRWREGTAEEITPAQALKAYLESKKVPPERAKVLQDYGEKLIAEQEKQI